MNENKLKLYTENPGYFCSMCGERLNTVLPYSKPYAININLKCDKCAICNYGTRVNFTPEFLNYVS